MWVRAFIAILPIGWIMDHKLFGKIGYCEIVLGFKNILPVTAVLHERLGLFRELVVL